jgi:hypothetical protein
VPKICVRRSRLGVNAVIVNVAVTPPPNSMATT